MSYYAADSRGYLRDIASVHGWHLFVEWADEVGGAVDEFVETGQSEDPDALAELLAKLEAPTPSVESTRRELLAAARAADEILILSDGTSDDQEPLRTAGGPGSGNFGHGGRPGEVGGSTSGEATTERKVHIPMDLFVANVLRGLQPDPNLKIKRTSPQDLRLTTTVPANADKFAEAGRNVGATVTQTTDGDTHTVEVKGLAPNPDQANEEITRYTRPLAMIGTSVPQAPYSRYLEKNGQVWKAQPLPAGVPKGEPKNCYGNATRLVLGNSDYNYVEGLAYFHAMPGVGVAHAWAVDKDGKVVDNTWSRPEDCEYFGVQYDRDQYFAHIVKEKVFGVFGGKDKGAKKVLDKGGL